MAKAGKYGDVKIPKIKPDEPVFILRAQDKLAEPILQMYQALAKSHQAPVAEKIAEVIDSFRSWNGERKIPD